VPGAVHSSEAAPAGTRLWEWRLDDTMRKVVGSRSLLYPDRVDDGFVEQLKRVFSVRCINCTTLQRPTSAWMSHRRGRGEKVNTSTSTMDRHCLEHYFQ
jgi:hypothetical protein